MREIKFRAYHKKKGLLVDVLDIYFTDKTIHLPIDTEVNDEYWWDSTTWDLSDVELMQYTGLKDKNGTEIYEADMLKLGFSGIAGKGYVYWCENNGQWWIEDTRKNVNKRNKGRKYPLYQPATFEVIGNIYEDKHLLEVQHD